MPFSFDAVKMPCCKIKYQAIHIKAAEIAGKDITFRKGHSVIRAFYFN